MLDGNHRRVSWTNLQNAARQLSKNGIIGPLALSGFDRINHSKDDVNGAKGKNADPQHGEDHKES